MKKEITPSKTGISRFSEEMRRGISEIKEQKKEIQKIRDTVFLLDVSGSMDEVVDNKRKIDHLKEVMRNYQEARKIVFSSHVEEVVQVPEPQTNTDMAQALRYLRGPPLTSVILVSDGEPDSREDAKQSAIALNTPINIIFIGERGSRGEEFMKELAHLTGGRELTVSTDDINIDFSRELKSSVGEMLSLPER